jgi:carbamate kinase
VTRTIVLALGGNAITKAQEKGTRDEQWSNVKSTCQYIVALAKEGHRIVITHGNGPQVGNLLRKNELAKELVPPMPLDVCVSNTQGSLGYAVCQNLGNYLTKAGLSIPVAAVVTQVIVVADDPAFQHPTKFVGSFFSEVEAAQLMAEKGFTMKEDSGRGWRRVVPSPEPKTIVEKDVIRNLLDAGTIVVAAGGGGIPVVENADGLTGVEAVIDKDMAGQLLANEVNADSFFLLTEVERVCINFGRPDQRQLEKMTVAEARKYQDEGQFPAGSMGPKVEAAIRFVSSGNGRQAVIVALEKANLALTGQSGTVITA